MDSIIYIIKTMIALIVVIWLANVVLKYINNLSNNQNKSIQIIERISVSKGSSLAIVKIVNEYYLMSFSENTTETLQKFSPEEAREIEARLEQQLSQQPSELLESFDWQKAKEKFAHYFEQQK